MRERVEGALIIAGPGNRFPLGYWDLEWGLRRKGDALGGQAGQPVVTPDGVKSKARKALGFKVICFSFLPQIFDSECGYFYSIRRF